MEGALNPWWSNLIKERVKAAHHASLPVPRTGARVDISYCNMMQKSISDQHLCGKGLHVLSLHPG
jgi:hypothetical protein